MSAGHVQVAPDGSGKDVDADALTSPEAGNPTVYRQDIVIADSTTYANKAAVTGANALKVDGSAVTQPVSGTFWQATQPVSGTVTANAGTGPATAWKVDLSSTGANATALKVDGSAVTQPVSGTVTVNAGAGPGTPWKVDLASTGANATAIKVDGSAVTQPVSGTFWQATQPVSLATNTPDVTDRTARLLGHVTVDNASLAVTGAFWQATQPINGNVGLLNPGGLAVDPRAVFNDEMLLELKRQTLALQLLCADHGIQLEEF